MTLGPGARLGPYEILSALGAGGMGEVYRARDTKLGRDVALKVLPESFTHDPERVARFRREAHVLASINHPQIGGIYGLEDSNGVTALVLELVEGPTLADRIAAGAMPIDEALPVAKQIAEALEAAHEQGIIHRDLKPANIKVRPDGTVKVLDFGLAKAIEVAGTAGEAGRAGLTQSPTITSPAMTQVGMILGTAAYMSPEQAKGRPADKRSDVWAFGCVLYEMLTGTRAFDGDDMTEVLGAVVRLEPNWEALPSDVPPLVRALLQGCLVKDRRRRVADISTTLFVLEKVASPDAMGTTASPPLRPRTALWWRALPWAVAAASFLVAGVMLAGLPARKALDRPWSLHATIEPGTDGSLSLVSLVRSGGQTRATGRAVVLSPDGRLLAFVAQRPAGKPQIYVRHLDQLAANPLPGTEDAGFPFFSPDSQWIAFFSSGKLKKMPVGGGPIVTLCDVLAGRGGSWGEDGTIVFTPNQNAGARLMRVSASGGTPEPITTLTGNEATHRWPQVLPGAVGVLYTASSSNTGPYDLANAIVQPLPSGRPTIVQANAAHAQYVASGHLVFVRAGTLFAVPFDLQRMEATGQAIPMVESVSYARDTGAAQFTFSDTGTLAYVSGTTSDRVIGLEFMDRAGKTTPLRATGADWSYPSFSPDGLRLAMAIRSGVTRDIWVYDWMRDTAQRLTLDSADDSVPVWTPDGQRLTFYSDRNERHVRNIYWQRVDGTGTVARLTDSQSSQGPGSWHPTGHYLAFHQANGETQNDLMILPLQGSEAEGWKIGQPTEFLKTPAREESATFSPDGNWLAYMSDETGRPEIYVRPFPGPGRAWQVSTSGGDIPLWSAKHHELIYRAPDFHLMTASYSTNGNAFTTGKPRFWSDRPVTGAFALHPDGDRVAIEAVNASEAQGTEKLTIITNFFDQMRRLAPGGR